MTEGQITEEIIRYLQDKSYNYSVLLMVSGEAERLIM